MASLAAFPKMLEQDRQRRGFTIGQVAWRLGVKPQEYRELEAGRRSPDFETWDRICKLYGWPQTFVTGGHRSMGSVGPERRLPGGPRRRGRMALFALVAREQGER